MSIADSDPMAIFLYAIKSKAAKKKYQNTLRLFFTFLGLEGTIEDQAKALVFQIKNNGTPWLTSKLISYLQFQKERAERREISEATVRNYYKPVKLFLEMNDFVLQWKKIVRGLPRGRKFAIDRAPTLDEIQKIIEYPDRRIKAIILTMCSSGIRVGAWDYLKWKDVVPVEKDGKVVAAKLVVYSGEADQYYSFISAEAYNELKKWIDYRESSGEKISGDSWLMRDLWNVEKFARGILSVPKKLRSSGVKRLIERALKAQGVRNHLPQGQRRYEFQTDHGFRKFFKTHAEQVMKPINVEILMGHSVGVSDSYYRPNEQEVLNDYQNAVPELTISEENRMINDVEKLRTNSSEFEETKKEIGLLKDEIRKMKLKSELAEMMKQGIAEWSEKNYPPNLPVLAKTDFRNTKGLDEIIEHCIKEHDGNIAGFRESFAKAKIRLVDD